MPTRLSVFDLLTSTGGAVVVVVLLVTGGLLIWDYSFTHSQVRNQLSQQQISFPPKSAFAHAKPGTEITPSMIPSVSQSAGQQLLTGPQAQAYANHFIAVHLSEMPYHGVYSKISAASRAHPNDARLQALKKTSFQGTTLRGLLLEAYGFWKIGTVTFWAAIASFCLASVMAILVVLGFWHARRTPLEAELVMPRERRAPLMPEPSSP